MLAAFAAATSLSASVSLAQVSGYVTDSRAENVRSSSLCVRTGYWTPALATLACDPDLVPKPAAAPAPAARPAVPPVAPAPKAAPKAAVKPVLERATFSADVLFEFDKADLRDEGRRVLGTLAGQIKAITLDVVVAVGHADRIGSKSYNQRLSVRRANAVKEYLVSAGIPANRIYAEGKGESVSLTGAKCRNMGAENRRNAKLVACLQPDRRVEIEVVGTRSK